MMQTLLITDDINNKDWTREVSFIKNDGLVVMPTETVYGLAANALSDKACTNIYLAKNRPADNPFIIHLSHIDMLSDFTKNVSDDAKHLFKTFSPGPLTIILEKKNISDVASAGLPTVGIRVPSHSIAHAFLKACDLPIAAPSANLSGNLSPTTFTMAKNEMMGRVNAIIDGGDCSFGLESTVISCVDNKIVLLREGSISKEAIQDCLGGIKIVSKTVALFGEKVLSPGQKYRHYKTKTDLYLLRESDDYEKLVSLLKNKKVAYILPSYQFKAVVNHNNVNHVNFMFDNMLDYGLKLYKVLSQIDEEKFDLIVAFYPDSNPDGRAICDRLYRSSGAKFLKDIQV